MRLCWHRWTFVFSINLFIDSDTFFSLSKIKSTVDAAFVLISIHHIIFFFKLYSINSSRLDMCRRNYPTDVCNRGTAGKCVFIAGTPASNHHRDCTFVPFNSFANSFHIILPFHVVRMYKL